MYGLEDKQRQAGSYFGGHPMMPILDKDPRANQSSDADVLKAFVKIPGLDPYGERQFSERQAALPNLTKDQLLSLKERVTKAIDTIDKREAEIKLLTVRKAAAEFVPGTRFMVQPRMRGVQPTFGTVVATTLAQPRIARIIEQFNREGKPAVAAILDTQAHMVDYVLVQNLIKMTMTSVNANGVSFGGKA